ncbi:MAG TPA: EAL domain-containing protein, partial [Gemmatimonadota bacterium]|nr:EAL domain-containing protein [Gemmatimonadota bacterium]
AALRMFGYDRERLIGASTELVHQDREHYERFGRESDAVLARGESYRTRGSLRRADGEVFPTEQVVSYVRPGASGDGGDRDDPQFAVSVVRDISEEVAAQRAIRESRDLLEAILEATADGIFVKEPSGRIVFANEAAARMLGREAPEDVVGHDDEELLSPGSLEAIRAVDERVLSTGEPLRAEERIVTAAGDDRLYDVTVAPLQVGEGRPAIVGAARDVTDQRRTERALREAHRLLDAVVEGTSDSVYAKDREGRYLLMNGAGARRLGRTVDEVVGRRDVDLRADEDARRIRQDDLRVMASGETLTRTETMVSPDGGRTVFDTLKAPLRDGGEIVGIVGISRNVTEREEAEEALRRTESKYETLFHATPLGIDVASLGDGRVVELNEGLEQLLGYSRRELLGRRAPEMGVWVDPSDRERLIEQVRQRGHARGFGAQLRRKDGQVIEAEMFAESIEVGGDPHMLSVIQDVTERRAFERDLERMALHDALTGLANRTLFRDRLEHGLVTSGRQDAPVAVLFVDLDRFKVVNDTLGHPVGDRLLAEAADRLRACFREEDTVARLGGDEFGIVLEHVDSTADVEATARRVAEQFERPFRLGETDVHQAASVGIAVSSGDLSDPDDLLRFSDIAMYRAKEHKGSSWHLFDPAVDAEAGRQLYRENELRRAIDDEQFVLHFQPVVDLGTGRIVGAEALLRWDHPERGLLPPGSFIPLAEETGLIAALGRWVIRTAPGYLAAWEQGGDRAPELRLSINISAVQLQDPVVAEELRATLAASGFPASRLILEVTESVAIRTPEIIQSLRADGMEVAVDDLGTGYASLEYLTHLEVDIMKVDRLFVSGVGRDARDDAIVEAAALLAHRLDARAVAEGIETAEQLARLRDLGYDLGQGFYFSEPLEPEAFGKLLAEDPRW